MQNLKSSMRESREERDENVEGKSPMQTNSSDVCVDSSPPSRKSKDGVLKLHDSCSNYETFYTT